MHLADGGAHIVVETATATTTADAVAWLQARLPSDGGSAAAIGIDTLTVWSTGPAGWRPADAWLRASYPGDAEQGIAVYGVNEFVIHARKS